MKLSEELIWRGFSAKTTIKNPEELDERDNRQFYWGADPSADSLTIGNLAALMMCACFVRHGYRPYLLVGGATGQIGDPKENSERELKPIEEIEYNKSCIKKQVKRVFNSEDTVILDNLDWFKDINYLEFLREVGKTFSMTQLLDRQFVQKRIGKGGCGISYAEFSYTLIQGYDFLHLFRKYGISLQLCGADQYGNCTSGIHLIRCLENAEADVWSTPLIIDTASGRKFGKSEGNAIWLSSTPSRRPDGKMSENYTSVFDFYQFWLNQPDSTVEYLLKIYTLYDKPTIEQLLADHAKAPEKRIAQKALAIGVTTVVHGERNAEKIANLTNRLFDKDLDFSAADIESFANLLPTAPLSVSLVDDLVTTGLAPSKSEARKLIKAGAITLNGKKILDDTKVVNAPALVKKGKNKFAIVC
jgi:tyrosyl-tRNA synthetase